LLTAKPHLPVAAFTCFQLLTSKPHLAVAPFTSFQLLTSKPHLRQDEDEDEFIKEDSPLIYQRGFTVIA